MPVPIGFDMDIPSGDMSMSESRPSSASHIAAGHPIDSNASLPGRTIGSHIEIAEQGTEHQQQGEQR
jgi:hypothetical protein